ncbi:HlyD family secretion protein [Magnetospirillum fulvum]|uniref:Multidrug resistance efflux pump n=1 Tax=Magnetospirillum fulvum MGU-K5 TaxID=1316936 RepID=S9TX94_MAGFU|nr:HlyD family efflux transporter periplasmic adaptor subunit [Magnetospirillum fulvum]EPY03000.1 multidrug resistance efflux pump [Magnetospirillum fulvum MGU-K5]
MTRLGLIVGLLLLAGCGDESVPVQGYAEGDYLRIGLPTAGQVAEIKVGRGGWVEPGDPLFSLDRGAEQAAVAEAQARLEQARHQRDNLLTGKRRLELRAIEAQRAQADADLRLAEIQVRRQEALIRTETTSQASLDNARAIVERDRARVGELSAQLAFAREGGRSSEILAAEAAVGAAQAALDQALVRLRLRSAEAPQAARVEDVLFRPGETVAAGQPVVSLLPPGNILVRFYLHPDQVGRIGQGSVVALSCTGCAEGQTATVSFIAREASYVPPILYSRDNKDKLAFLVEARPTASAERLRPGQPVSVTLPPNGPAK